MSVCLLCCVYDFMCINFISLCCRWVILRDVQRVRLYSKRFDRWCRSLQNKMKNSRFFIIKALHNYCSKWFHKPEELECFGVFFFGFETMYRILFTCFSLVGVVHSGYWYCGCLLYVFLKSTLLGQVLTALYRSGKSIS